MKSAESMLVNSQEHTLTHRFACTDKKLIPQKNTLEQREQVGPAKSVSKELLRAVNEHQFCALNIERGNSSQSARSGEQEEAVQRRA